MLCAFAFDDGRLHFRNRFVRTKEWAEEEAANRLIHRNTFGTQPRGGWTANAFNMIQKNVANTHVVRWGGKLLALWEAAQPYALDPATLETRGIDTLGGTLRQGMPFTTGAKRSTMRCPGCRATCCRRTGGSTRPIRRARATRRAASATSRTATARSRRRTPSSGPRRLRPELMIYEFDSAEGGGAAAAAAGPLVHDFAVTENYYLWFQNRATSTRRPLCSARRTPPSSSYDGSRPTKITWCRAIRRRRQQRELEIDAASSFTTAAREEAGGELGETIVIDSVVLEAFPDFVARALPDDGQGRAAATPSTRSRSTVQALHPRLAESDARARHAAHAAAARRRVPVHRQRRAAQAARCVHRVRRAPTRTIPSRA